MRRGNPALKPREPAAPAAHKTRVPQQETAAGTADLVQKPRQPARTTTNTWQSRRRAPFPSQVPRGRRHLPTTRPASVSTGPCRPVLPPPAQRAQQPRHRRETPESPPPRPAGSSSSIQVLQQQLYDSLPWLMRRLPGPHQDVFQQYRHLNAFIKEEIKGHRQNWSPGEPQDLIDYYLDKLSKVTNEPTTTFNEENMIQMVFDFFMAGSETTSSTLVWALLYMLENPDIQDRVQEELNEVVGRNNPIKYEDRTRLHYTNAVVHEIQRYANLVPGSILHACSRDTIFMGLPVCKGTVIYPNLGSVLCDPEHWETPRHFNPGHFLDKEGRFVSKEAFLSFGAGPRLCLGESLARMELFCFFTSLLRNFTFRLPEGVTSVNTEAILGSMRQPHPFQICAVAR